jgi:hypothetical protein
MMVNDFLIRGTLMDRNGRTATLGQASAIVFSPPNLQTFFIRKGPAIHRILTMAGEHWTTNPIFSSVMPVKAKVRVPVKRRSIHLTPLSLGRPLMLVNEVKKQIMSAQRLRDWASEIRGWTPKMRTAGAGTCLLQLALSCDAKADEIEAMVMRNNLAPLDAAEHAPGAR